MAFYHEKKIRDLEILEILSSSESVLYAENFYYVNVPGPIEKLGTNFKQKEFDLVTIGNNR